MGDHVRVGIRVDNLFIRAVVESAVRGAGAWPIVLPKLASATGSGCGVLIAELEGCGADAAAAFRPLMRAGLVVLAFTSTAANEAVVAAREAGAVVLARSAFLARLPRLLDTALSSLQGEQR
ncbi:MAG: hypothetical protein V1750_06105 [Acidobacteriota bacterium]